MRVLKCVVVCKERNERVCVYARTCIVRMLVYWISTFSACRLSWSLLERIVFPPHGDDVCDSIYVQFVCRRKKMVKLQSCFVLLCCWIGPRRPNQKKLVLTRSVIPHIQLLQVNWTRWWKNTRIKKNLYLYLLWAACLLSSTCLEQYIYTYTAVLVLISPSIKRVSTGCWTRLLLCSPASSNFHS